MTKIMMLPVFILAGFGEGTPQQDSMWTKWIVCEIRTHGRILLQYVAIIKNSYLKAYTKQIIYVIIFSKNEKIERDDFFGEKRKSY